MYSRPAVESDLFSLIMFATKEQVELIKSRIDEVVITQSDFNDPEDFVKFTISGQTIVYIKGY